MEAAMSAETSVYICRLILSHIPEALYLQCINLHFGSTLNTWKTDNLTALPSGKEPWTPSVINCRRMCSRADSTGWTWR